MREKIMADSQAYNCEHVHNVLPVYTIPGNSKNSYSTFFLTSP
jgi:hypothetical protein